MIVMKNTVSQLYKGWQAVHRNYVGHIDDKGYVWNHNRNLAGRVRDGLIYRGRSSNIAGMIKKDGRIYIGRSSNIAGRVGSDGRIYHKRSSNIVGMVHGGDLLVGAAVYLLLFHEPNESDMDKALKTALPIAAAALLLSENEDSDESDSCYIATAVYENCDAPEVLILREFRDRCLKKSYFGRLFISIYYLVSPPIANRLKKAKRLNSLAKVILNKIVYHAKNAIS